MNLPITGDVDSDAIESSLLSKYPDADISIREVTVGGRTTSLILEAADVTIEELESSLPELGVPLEEGNYNVESMGSALGDRFFAQTIKALIFAFIAMALVVFITFRSWVASSFVVLAAFSDIISTLAVINLLGIKMSTAGLAALLMLIGYSVDTDILMTTKVKKISDNEVNIIGSAIANFL